MLGFLPKYNLIVLLLNSINAQLRSYNHYIFSWPPWPSRLIRVSDYFFKEDFEWKDWFLLSVWNYGHERRDDEWCNWWCHGRWGGWWGEVIEEADNFLGEFYWEEDGNIFWPVVYALKGQCGLMVSALVHRIERIRVETWPPHCIVLLGKMLNSHSASFHSGQGCSKLGWDNPVLV